MACLSEKERTQLRALITSYSGLSEALQSDDALERAIGQRLEAHNLDSAAEYWPVLQRRSRVEMNSLVQLLTNKETFFLREMHHFDVLRERVLPTLMARRKYEGRPSYMNGPALRSERGPLRLWSAGCSTGEEAYSLALTLLEYQRRHGFFEAEVIGTDIDANALETARRGRYGERAVRLVPDRLRRQYFHQEGETYQIQPEVARLVKFQVFNLAEDRSPPELTGFDVIFCRNVTIYFDEAARDRLNARLADSLHEGGYLFVASAETMGHNRKRLELFPVGNTFLFRKRAAEEHPLLSAATAPPPVWQLTRPLSPERSGAPPPASRQQSTAPKQSQPTAPLASSTVFEKACTEFERQRYDAALRELDALFAESSVALEVYTLRAAIFMQQERLAEAEAACQFLLAHDPWHSDAHFMMGTILFHQGQADAAIESLKTVIYLQPEHRWAHFYLAEAYRALGLANKARREYKNTLNIVQYRPWPAYELNLSGIDDDVLRQACESNLANLGEHKAKNAVGRNEA